MNKMQFDKIIEAISEIKGDTPYNVALLLLSGDRLAGVLHLPPSNTNFVRLDVTRIAGAHLEHGPILTWINVEAIQAVALD